MRARAKVVLYYPRLTDTSRRPAAGLDVLPLSVMTLAGLPKRAGFEVVVIDGNLSRSPEEAHRRAVEACEGALVFGATGILGHQVADAELVARAVRERRPKVARIVGGWFASVLPEPYLADGLYDAVCLGQGELTFLDYVEARAAGEPLDAVPGLALLRDGALAFTAHRPVVGWSQLAAVPWELLDFEPYRRGQVAQRTGPLTERLPRPRALTDPRPHIGIAYYASFGCPEPCAFCCSPEVTSRRWKAMSAGEMLDDLEELTRRWGFDVVRFHDANFGVSEKRVREFCEGKLARGLRWHWFAMLQAHSVLRYAKDTLDLMAESGCFIVNIGAEAGSDEMMARIGKNTHGDENVDAAVEMSRRGIDTWMTYIIGFPDEERGSMLATIEQARRIRALCPGAHPAVWPYQPIPGTPMYRRAVELGFQPPRNLAEWGAFGDYHLDETWPGRIPPDIKLRRRLFQHYSSLSLGIPRGRVGWWERRASRRIASGSWRGARVEAKAFDLVARMGR